MGKTALITGVSGQDGAYLAKLLLGKGYRVVGATRRSASSSFARLDYLGIAGEVEPYGCELLELSNIVHMIERVKPDEIYNLAAQSFVGASFDQPIFTVEVNALGAIRLLEAMRLAAEHPLLSGLDLGDVRQWAGAAGGDDAVPSAQSLRRRQADGA